MSEAMSTDAPCVCLVGSGGKSVFVRVRHALLSRFVCNELKVEPPETTVEGPWESKYHGHIVRVPDVPRKESDRPSIRADESLPIIAEWLTHHAGVAPPKPVKPLRSKVMRDVCADPWDADFLDRFDNQKDLLYKTINVVHHMGIESLVYQMCAKVASWIKGQPVERIRTILVPDNPPATDSTDKNNPTNKV